MPKRTTSFKIDPDNHDKIKEQIKNTDITQGEWIRDAIKQKLNAEHDDLESLQDKVESIDERLNAVESAIIQSTNQGRRGTAAGDHYDPTDTDN